MCENIILFKGTICILNSRAYSDFAKPPAIQFIWRPFLQKCVSMTTFVIRGEPAVKREERRCIDEITFVEVASTVVPAGSRQSDSAGRKRAGGGRGQGGEGWMSMPHRRRRHHCPTLLVREIARYIGR